MHDNEMSEYLARIAHDIRSPITSIGGFAELLEQSLAEGDERLTYVRAIQRAAQRLRSLADRIAGDAEASEGQP
ncbi:hypothetical protein EPN42_03015 [bacterium]|nr:MAG: hypothetical protein EPN42_03015 [bacterium]